MKRIRQTFLFLSALLAHIFPVAAAPATSEKTAYDFRFEALNGESLPLSAYRGKVLLIVNTASKCGFTPQYKGLEALYRHYKEKGLVIIGVPSNDFGAQEPGSAQEIKNFCEINYGVTFPMAAKQAVIGDSAHPFYLWAREVLGSGAAPKWNFHKYLIDKNGHLVDYFGSMTAPDAERVQQTIEAQLSAPSASPSASR